MPCRTGARLWAFVLAAGIGSTCGDGNRSSPVSPTGPPCTAGEIRSTVSSATFGSSAQPVGVSGGSFTARVTVSGNCQWTVASDATWVTPEAGGTGVGSGLLAYRVASNAAVARQARLTLFAGQPSGVLSLTQDGPVAAAGCTYELRPTTRSFAATPSAAEVQVFAPYGCRWAFEGNGSWISVGPEDSRPSPWGDGNGTVVVVLAANASTGPRTGSATIAGQPFAVTQDGWPAMVALPVRGPAEVFAATRT